MPRGYSHRRFVEAATSRFRLPKEALFDTTLVVRLGGRTVTRMKRRLLLRSIGGRVPRARRTGLGIPDALRERGVTLREAEVLTLVAEGMTNPEIAQHLLLSPRTVQTHVSSLLAKLGVPTRAGLISVGVSLKAERGPGRPLFCVPTDGRCRGHVVPLVHATLVPPERSGRMGRHLARAFVEEPFPLSALRFATAEAEGERGNK